MESKKNYNKPTVNQIKKQVIIEKITKYKLLSFIPSDTIKMLYDNSSKYTFKKLEQLENIIDQIIIEKQKLLLIEKDIDVKELEKQKNIDVINKIAFIKKLEQNNILRNLPRNVKFNPPKLSNTNINDVIRGNIRLNRIIADNKDKNRIRNLHNKLNSINSHDDELDNKILLKRINKSVNDNIQKIKDKIIDYMPIEDTLEVLAVLNPNNKPFNIKIKSLKTGFEMNKNYGSIEHYMNDLNFDIKNSENKNYDENNTDITSIGGESFGIVKLYDFNLFNGGCCKDSKRSNIKIIETHIAKYELYNPLTDNNNCGLKAIEKLLTNNLTVSNKRYIEIKKQYNLSRSEKIPADILIKIYNKFKLDSEKLLETPEDKKKYKIKDLQIITDIDNYNKKLNNIYLHNEHYQVILSCELKQLDVPKEDLNTKLHRGTIFLDLETRNDISTGYDLATKKPYTRLIIDENTPKTVLFRQVPITLHIRYHHRYQDLTKETIIDYEYEKFELTDEKISDDEILDDEKKPSSACGKFLLWLNYQKTKYKHSFNIYAHNGANFDYHFFIKYLNITNIQTFLLRGMSIINLTYNDNIFRDTYLFLPFSLDTLCDSFKIESPKFKKFIYNGKVMTPLEICFYKPELSPLEFIKLKETEPEFWEIYNDYCKRDIDSLSEIWLKFTRAYNNILDLMSNKLVFKSVCNLNKFNTIASACKKIFIMLNDNSHDVKPQMKYKYNDVIKFIGSITKKSSDNQIKTINEKYNFIRKFIIGGISHCHKPGKYMCEVVPYDIKSDYSASSIHMRIPAGLSVWSDKPKYTGQIGFYYLEDLIFDTDYTLKPVINDNLKGVRNWNTGKYVDSCYMTNYDIDYNIKNYGLKKFKIIKALLSKDNKFINGSDIFGTYVSVLYDAKQLQDDYKNNKSSLYNPALRETIKLMLNSLTGKMIEDTMKYNDITFTTEDTKKNINGYNVMLQNNGHINEFSTIGIMIYSYSKRLLFEYIKLLPNNSENIIAIETDGFSFKREYENDFINNVNNYITDKNDYYPIKIGDNLGNVECEYVTVGDSYFLGKKEKYNYYFDISKNKYIEKMTQKGVRVTTKDLYGSDVTLLNKNVYEHRFNGNDINLQYTSIKKKLFGDENEHGIYCVQTSRTLKGLKKEHQIIYE